MEGNQAIRRPREAKIGNDYHHRRVKVARELFTVMMSENLIATSFPNFRKLATKLD
jgi:hypothetical protein